MPFQLSRARVIRPGDSEANWRDVERIYWGDETCGRGFPELSETLDALERCQMAGIGFTLLTPPVAVDDWVSIETTLRTLHQRGWIGEVVVNDLGVLDLAHTFEFEPVVGRLLLPVTRDPRLLNIKAFKARLDECGFNRDALSWYKDTYGVRRFELQPTLTGTDATLIASAGAAVSVYSPYSMITRSRECMIRRRFGCEECSQIFIRYDHSDFTRPTWIHHNTVVFENPWSLDTYQGPDELRLVDNRFNR